MITPDRIGGFRILGTLGSGGQGVVHLGESPDGEKVAIKVLHRVSGPEAAARFLREARVLPEVASFCTAQVLGTGSEDGVPYIVSEYIDGPTLQAGVRERGPIAGRELRRLAVGTITALAAIHRAGVVHRDFKPANVLLSREGPRVIDFGIARAAAGETTIGGAVGTPAYMAPEQFENESADTSADLFAWAATIVFAATGRAPFGQDSVPAILRRLTTEEPDLGGLEGDLREIVAGCLAKDPGARPRASQVLLRLLGHPPVPDPPSRPVRGGPTVPTRRRTDSVSEGVLRQGLEESRRPRRGRAALVVGTALALAVAITGGVLLTRQQPEKAAAPTTPAPAGPVVRPAPVLSGPPAADVIEMAVPELKATFYESPRDPVRLSSFTVKEEDLRQPSYVRKPETTEFLRLPVYREPIIAPDGKLVASVYQSPKYAPDENNTVEFTDRSLATVFTVPTVEPPLVVKRPIWNRESSKVLVTVTDTDGKGTGFAVVDLATRTSRYVEVSGLTKESVFGWAPDGSVYLLLGGPVRFYSPDGRLQRTVAGIRSGADQPAAVNGSLMAGGCAGPASAVCVIDYEKDRKVGEFPLAAKHAFWGWYNRDHLLIYNYSASPWRVDIVDLSGKRVRRFASLQGDKDTFWRLYWMGG
ncbi:serine/threonine protein kinase [Nonomuraea typhae]|uniref:serine/threonine protein kinase n=1 Tax=Nonomuraea typhae TaxID=2603600 RepID=UPI0012F7AF03|nr:serine/threonine-protein kinase [Nonomuraea typhae]